MAASSSLDHLSNRMKLEWTSKLNTEMVPAKNFRRTSIIGTIGMFRDTASVPWRHSYEMNVFSSRLGRQR